MGDILSNIVFSDITASIMVIGIMFFHFVTWSVLAMVKIAEIEGKDLYSLNMDNVNPLVVIGATNMTLKILLTFWVLDFILYLVAIN